MTRHNLTRLRPHLPIGIIFISFVIITSVISLKHPLWASDEVETALFARSILKHGVPLGWDGTNIIGVGNGIVLGESLIATMIPWPQLYLTAASFALFGQSTFTARLPFLFLSWLTMLVIYVLTYHVYKNKRTAIIAALLWTTSVPVLLYSIQSRYYPMVMTFAALTLLSSLKMREKTSIWDMAYIISSIMLLYSQYVSGLLLLSSMVLALGAFTLLAPKNIFPVFNPRKIVFYTVFSVFCLLPYLTILKPYQNHGLFRLISIREFVETTAAGASSMMWTFHTNNTLPFTLLLLALLLMRHKYNRNNQDNSVFLWLGVLIGTYMITVSIASALLTSHLTLTEERYHVAIYPLAALFIAGVFQRISQKSQVLAIGCIILYTTTNIWTLPPVPTSNAVLMGVELAVPYTTPDQAVATFLTTYAKDGDTVFVDNDPSHDYLQYYVPHALRYINRIHPDHDRILGAYPFPQYIYAFDQMPDWIVMYGRTAHALSIHRATGPLGLPDGIDWSHYDMYTIPIYYDQKTRPELSFHMFVPKHADADEMIYIYEKRKNARN